MRKLYALLLLLGIVGFGFLFAYAFIPQAKAWMDATIAPPIHGVFGGLINAITGSHIWQTYVIPWPNQLIIGCVLLGFPIAWLWHKTFNRVRTIFVHSAAKESGVPMMEPITQSNTSAPVPIATTEKEETSEG